MSDNDEGYNGWSNWETWNAYNWISGDYNNVKYFEKLARYEEFEKIKVEAKIWLEGCVSLGCIKDFDAEELRLINYDEIADAFKEGVNCE